MCYQSGRIGGSCVVDSMRGYLLGNANDQRAVGSILGGLLLEEDNTLADAVPRRWTLATFVTNGHLFMGCLYCG